MNVKDLKEKLGDMDDDSDVVLCFNLKDEGVHYVYLAEVLNIRYDGVLKETQTEPVVELGGYKHEFCSYDNRG